MANTKQNTNTQNASTKTAPEKEDPVQHKGTTQKGIAIETDVPIPKGRSAQYPFHEMKIGDSFYLSAKPDEIKKVATRLRSASSNYRKKNDPNIKFRVKTFDDGVRIWRVE